MYDRAASSEIQHVENDTKNDVIFDELYTRAHGPGIDLFFFVLTTLRTYFDRLIFR